MRGRSSEEICCCLSTSLSSAWWWVTCRSWCGCSGCSGCCGCVQVPLSLWAAWAIYSQPTRFRSLFPHHEARRQAVASNVVLPHVSCCVMSLIFQFCSSRFSSSSPFSSSGSVWKCSSSSESSTASYSSLSLLVWSNRTWRNSKLSSAESNGMSGELRVISFRRFQFTNVALQEFQDSVGDSDQRYFENVFFGCDMYKGSSTIYCVRHVEVIFRSSSKLCRISTENTQRLKWWQIK